MISTQFDILATWLRAHARSDRGATMVEYALLVALIGVALIVVWSLLSDGIGSTADKATSELNDA